MKDRDVHLLNINLLHSLYVASLPLKCQNGVFIFTCITGNSGIDQPVSISSRLFVYFLLCGCTNRKQLVIIKHARFLTNLDKKLSLF